MIAGLESDRKRRKEEQFEYGTINASESVHQFHFNLNIYMIHNISMLVVCMI